MPVLLCMPVLTASKMVSGRNGLWWIHSHGSSLRKGLLPLLSHTFLPALLPRNRRSFPPASASDHFCSARRRHFIRLQEPTSTTWSETRVWSEMCWWKDHACVKEKNPRRPASHLSQGDLSHLADNLALLAQGEEGLQELLKILGDEFRLSMALAGKHFSPPRNNAVVLLF